MWNALGVSFSLAVLGLGYSHLYQMLDDHHRGLLIFFSIAAAVVVLRKRG